jgi:N-acetylmuramoyl-L-alanine amidase
MTFSPLTNGTAPHHNKFSSRFNTPIKRVIVHHWAGVRGGDSRLTNPSADVSANYILYSDGRLIGQVPEDKRAWTSGSPAADNQSITVETQNTEVGGDWPVSDAAIAKLTELIADVAKRYGWGSVGDSNVIGHREVAATACPGPYLFSRLPAITENANAMLNSGGGSSPAPATPPTGSIAELADAVLRGDYGNGPARKAALGSLYGEVQAEVNRRLSGAKPAEPTPAPAPTPEPVVTQRTHTVVSGDTLWGIAEKYYGNGADWPRIHEANSGQISNPNLIFPGQQFIIP